MYHGRRREIISTDTKEQILKKAKKLFAKHGFDGVSIRSICDKAACNVSAISYHFGSKEELYRACLSEGGSNIFQLMDNILLPVQSREDLKAKLRLFMVQFLEDTVSNRDLILMISRDVSSKLAMESMNKIFQKIPERLTEFFQDAMDKGILRQDLDPALLGDFITQPIFMQTLFADVAKSLKGSSVLDASYRSHYVEKHLLLFFGSILNE